MYFSYRDNAARLKELTATKLLCAALMRAQTLLRRHTVKPIEKSKSKQHVGVF